MKKTKLELVKLQRLNELEVLEKQKYQEKNKLELKKSIIKKFLFQQELNN